VIDKTFTVDATPRVEVQIQSGTVRFQAHDSDEIRVMADARDPSRIEVTRRGSTVVIKSPGDGWLSQNSTDVTIYLPGKAEAVVSTASADIRANTPLTSLEVNTASGDVEFDVVDHLEVRTASGDVRGNEVTGSARVVSASGAVRIDSCAGKGSFSSASGDVDINRCSGGSMTASTASGDVSVNNCRSSEVTCRSMSGSVSLGLPPRTKAHLDVNTMSGSVNLPEPRPTTDEPEQQVSIKVRLVSGDVNLFRAE
jgi:DUF4097 and DUF4098 domain-containing protein YvlB